MYCYCIVTVQYIVTFPIRSLVRETMYTVYTVCRLLAVLLVCAAQENKTEQCVSNYHGFEIKSPLTTLRTDTSTT